MPIRTNRIRLLVAGLIILVAAAIDLTSSYNNACLAQGKKKSAAPQPVITYPPKLPGGKLIVTDSSPAMLKPPETLQPGVAIAKTPPTVDFMYFPGQDYEGKPWSNWGDSLAVGGKYYASIGDHLAPQGNAFVYEYDPQTMKLRLLADVQKVLKMPEGHYVPGKIHGRLDMGSDGWLYYSTHRGSPRVTNDQYFYKGDWIFRTNPATAETEIVVQGPVPKHCIPNTVLDPERLIFYGGTAAGEGGEEDGVQFFAYDCKSRKLLYSGPDGPARYMMFAASTGRLYYVPGKGESPLMRYDPAAGGPPVKIDGQIGVRAATQETPQGLIYTASLGQGGLQATLYSFNTQNERVKSLGPAAVGSQSYVATIDADPSGRYLYYVPGAHGGSERDGSAIVRFDTQTRTKKVIAFLHPFYQDKYGCIPKGTYSVAVDPEGDKLYITWNVSRGSRAWDCCALTVVHIPASERTP